MFYWDPIELCKHGPFRRKWESKLLCLREELVKVLMRNIVFSCEDIFIFKIDGMVVKQIE